MDFELSLLPVAASTAAGLACYVIYRRLVGSKPTNDATAAAVAAKRKVLFADESYDDWQSVLSLESWDAFDAYFQAKYIDTEVFAGGATVVISDKQGVVHRRVFGDHKEDSVYCAYSVTKIVTTVACLQLRDEGKLDLDDPMSKHLAGWVDADRPAEPGVTAKPITIRHCLNHTSGLGYYVFDQPMHSALERTACKAKDKLSKPTLAELSSWIGKEGPIAFEPGQQFFYADAHNSVAAIIEQISGLDYETYLQQKIFGPLGMVDTTFCGAARPLQQGARGHQVPRTQVAAAGAAQVSPPHPRPPRQASHGARRRRSQGLNGRLDEAQPLPAQRRRARRRARALGQIRDGDVHVQCRRSGAGRSVYVHGE